MTSENITPTPAPGPAKPTCPECGAEIRDPSAKRCWLCKEPLGERPRLSDEELARRIRLPSAKGDSPAWAVVAVLTLLLFGGLLFTEAYGIVIVLLIVAVPALIRTVVMASRQREAGAPADSASVLVTFLTSLGIVVVVGIAAGVAFYASCFAVCLGMFSLGGARGSEAYILPISVGLGLIPCLLVFVLLMRRLWPRKG
jgi:hypothetical protein